jgi:hypothetical protein
MKKMNYLFALRLNELEIDPILNLEENNTNIDNITNN